MRIEFQLPLSIACHPEPRRQRQSGSDRGISPTCMSLKPLDRVIRKSVHVCEVPHFVRDDGGRRNEILR